MGISLGAVAVVTQLAWLVTGVHALWVLCSTAAIVLGSCVLASAWAGRTVGPSRRAGTPRAAAVVSAGVAAASAVVSGAGRTSDVEYGSALPNSFLDISARSYLDTTDTALLAQANVWTTSQPPSHPVSSPTATPVPSPTRQPN